MRSMACVPLYSRLPVACSVRYPPGLFCQGCARSVPSGVPLPLLSANYESKEVNNEHPMGYCRSIPDEIETFTIIATSWDQKQNFRFDPNILGSIPLKRRMPQPESFRLRRL